MSDGSLANSDNIRVKNDFRKAAIVYGVLLAVVLLGYFLGGKALIETARTAQENKRLELEIGKQQKLLDEKHTEVSSGLQILSDAFKDSNIEKLDNLTQTRSKLEQLEHTVQNLLDQINPLLQMAQKQEMKVTREKADTAAAYVLANQVWNRLDKLQENLHEWEFVREELLNSQDGRRIAANPKLFANFADLKNLSVALDQGKLDVHKSRLAPILAQLEQAKNDSKPSAAVDGEHLTYIKAIDKPIKEGLEQIELIRRQLAQILTEAKTEFPGETTLANAITKHIQKRDRDLQDVQSRAFKKYIHEGAEDRGKQLADATNALKDSKTREEVVELARLNEESRERALKKRVDNDVIKRRNDAQQIVLDFDRDLPEIQSLLTPFITDGKTQPAFPRKGYMLSMFALCYEKPVSLTAIRGAQLLDPGDPESLERLFFYGGHGNNFRQQGGFPTYSEVALKRNPVISNKVKRAQELLIKYGELLVEKGLLLD